jgi:hypothetical protein
MKSTPSSAEIWRSEIERITIPVEMGFPAYLSDINTSAKRFINYQAFYFRRTYFLKKITVLSPEKRG